MMRKATRAFEVERKSSSVVASLGLGALTATLLLTGCGADTTVLGPAEPGSTSAISESSAPAPVPTSDPAASESADPAPQGDEVPQDAPELLDVTVPFVSYEEVELSGRVCGTDTPGWVSFLISNPTSDYIIMSPRFRVEALNKKGKVVWSWESGIAADLGPKKGVSLTGLLLCDDVYDRVDSVRVTPLGPSYWQTVENRGDKYPILEATDIKLIPYSNSGGPRADVKVEVENRSPFKVPFAMVSVVLYDADDVIVGVGIRDARDLKPGEPQRVEILGAEWSGSRPVRAEAFVVPNEIPDMSKGDWDCTFFSPGTSSNVDGHYVCSEG